jgi:CheY-like chemotaxis protein
LGPCARPSHSKPEEKWSFGIDDNEDMLDCEQAFLKIFGYGVLTAPSGGEGLELYSVDVIIVAYFTTEMSGHEVAIELRRLMPQAPIIMPPGAGCVPEQALKSVDAFVAKDRLASELCARDCAMARMMLIDCEAPNIQQLLLSGLTRSEFERRWLTQLRRKKQ